MARFIWRNSLCRTAWICLERQAGALQVDLPCRQCWDGKNEADSYPPVAANSLLWKITIFNDFNMEELIFLMAIFNRYVKLAEGMIYSWYDDIVWCMMVEYLTDFSLQIRRTRMGILLNPLPENDATKGIRYTLLAFRPWKLAQEPSGMKQQPGWWMAAAFAANVAGSWKFHP